MPHYELIYETGTVSVANYKDDDEMRRAVGEHHTRAKNGEAALTHFAADEKPRTAERIVKVLKYDYHPGDFGIGQDVSIDDAKAAFDAAVSDLGDGSQVNAPELAGAIRNMTSPLVAERPTKHESNYKMPETAAFDQEEWDQ